jgi:hypothetical protein
VGAGTDGNAHGPKAAVPQAPGKKSRRETNGEDGPAVGSARSPIDRRRRRLAVDVLVERANHLPPAAKALAIGYWALGLDPRELAYLHGLTARQCRRRIANIRETLEDPAFVLTARYADDLPKELRALARAYWVDGSPLRALAAARGRTIYWVRRRLGEARSLLLLQHRGEKAIPTYAAERALARRNRSPRTPCSPCTPASPAGDASHHADEAGPIESHEHEDPPQVRDRQAPDQQPPASAGCTGAEHMADRDRSRRERPCRMDG